MYLFNAGTIVSIFLAAVLAFELAPYLGLASRQAALAIRIGAAVLAVDEALCRRMNLRSADELAVLQTAASLTATLTQLAVGRRFLVKSTGQAPRWFEQGFAIGPHG